MQWVVYDESIVFSYGILERQPTLKWVLGERDIGWLPDGLERMDEPHRGGTWPALQRAIEEPLADVDEHLKRKRRWDNVSKLYRLDS